MAKAQWGELSRAPVHEVDEPWPELVEIVCYWGPGRKKRRSIEISADQFFGLGGHGAPLSGDELIAMVNNLRRYGRR